MEELDRVEEKEIYEPVEVEIIMFDIEDVITTSGGDDDPKHTETYDL